MPVLHGVDFEARPGEIVLILGPNGAGKTTLLKATAGFIRPYEGEITLDQTSLVGMKPEKIARMGLRLVLEGHRIFPELTVADNLRLGQLALMNAGAYPERLQQVLEIFPVLREKMESYARDLSGGQQQILALGQSFIGEPKILMCDEPSQGIALALIPNILRVLRTLADSGMGVVIVEQMPESALQVADRVVVLQRGSTVAQGPSSDFRGREDMKRWLLAL